MRFRGTASNSRKSVSTFADYDADVDSHRLWARSVQWDFAIKSVNRKANVINKLSSFVFQIILLIMFCFYFLHDPALHESVLMCKSLRQQFLTYSLSEMKTVYTFDKIKNCEEFEEYITEVITPILTSTDSRLGGMMLVGAMRFRTQRVRSDTCTLMDTIIPRGVANYKLKCYGVLNDHTEDKGEEMNATLEGHNLWQYKSCKEIGGTSYTGVLNTYHCGGYYFDVPFWTPNNFTQKYYLFSTQKYNLMQTQVFLDHIDSRTDGLSKTFIDGTATRLAVVEFYVYNPSTRLFGSVKLVSEVGSGSIWTTSASVETFHFWSSQDYGHFGYVIAFFIIVTLSFLWTLHTIISQLLIGTVTHKQSNFTVILFDFCLYILLLTSGIMTLVFATRCQRIKLDLPALVYANEYPTRLDSFRRQFVHRRNLNGFITILLFVRMIIFLNVFQHVRIALESVWRAGSLVVGVGLLFALNMTVFAMLSYVYLHRISWKFRTVDSSYQTLFYILIRQINLNEFFFEIETSRKEGTRFILFAFVMISYGFIIALYVGVLRVSYMNTIELQPATSEVSYMVEYLKDLVHHVNKWPSYLCRYLVGIGEVELQRQCARRLQKYRALLFPSQQHLPTLALTRAYFEEAMRVEETEERYRQSVIAKNISDGAHSEEMEKGRSFFKRFFMPSSRYVFSTAEKDKIWSFLLYEWKMLRLSKQAQKVKDEVWWTSEGVQQVLEEHIMLLKEFPRRLHDLEVKISDTKTKLTIEEQPILESASGNESADDM